MKTHIGENIKKFRELKGITQDQLSEMTGLSVNYIYRLENAKREPSLETLNLISNKLDVPAELIIFDYKNPKNEVDELIGKAYEAVFAGIEKSKRTS